MTDTKSPSTSEVCPSAAELEAFVLGDLSERKLERIADHVELCPHCDAALSAFDDRKDELVADLRSLPEGGAAPSAPVPDPLIEVARDTLDDGNGSEPTVDPGRRIARSLDVEPYRLGKFELVEEIGTGTFGYVFRARDTELDRTVAIKLQRAALPEHGDERDRFLREARSAAQLEHPNIVTLYETGETSEGVAYLVTEFIEGTTLESRLGEGPIAFDESARLVARVARALESAHRHGIVHRDIKPSNIMLDVEGVPHVMDFGLAKREAGEITVTPDGVLMGTPAYMSPEIARGDAHGADARSDVYSLGVILYELLAGERPFRGIRRMLVLQVLEDDPRPPRRLDDKIPRDLETICLKAMEKAPARRYTSAEELALDLERYLAGEPILARPLVGFERLWRWCRRNQLAACLFVAILLGSAFGFWHLSRLSGELVRGAAVESAAQYAEMLEVVNELYSSDVVQRVGHHGVDATADYLAAEGEIPLPATLLTVLLERVSEQESGMAGRHYSEFPFRTRADGGPRSELEWEALRHLQENPAEPFQRFVEAGDGRPALFYATARVMQPSCVECHNAHPDSTKRDWQVGDVRGVLEIVRPLALDEVRTREGLRGSFLLVGLVSVVLFGLFVSIVVVGDRRRRVPR